MDHTTHRIERLLTRRNAWIALALLVVISGCAGFALRNVRMD